MNAVLPVESLQIGGSVAALPRANDATCATASQKQCPVPSGLAKLCHCFAEAVLSRCRRHCFCEAVAHDTHTLFIRSPHASVP